MKEQVFNCFSIGYNNKISYEDIQVKTGFCRRKVRNLVQELREDGNAIISSSTFFGFYLPENNDKGLNDVVKLKNETMHRINELMKTVECCDKYIQHYEESEINL